MTSERTRVLSCLFLGKGKAKSVAWQQMKYSGIGHNSVNRAILRYGVVTAPRIKLVGALKMLDRKINITTTVLYYWIRSEWLANDKESSCCPSCIRRSRVEDKSHHLFF